MFDFKLPDLGEGVHEGQIVNVLVREGDTIAEYQPMLEVETDKAAVEIPSPKSGTVSKVHVSAGETVKVGQVLLTIDDNGAATATHGEPARAQAAAAARAAEERPSGPATGERTAPARHVPAQEASAKGPPVAAAPADSEEMGRAAPATDGPVAAAPAVRKLARELGVDINRVPGSGPKGRILREDVERFAQGKQAPPKAAGEPEAPPVEKDVPAVAPGPAADATLPDFSQYGPIRREPVPQIRKTIARQMTRAWRNVPRVTHQDVADVTELERNRKAFNQGLPENQAGLTMTAITVRAVAAALGKYPMLNASYEAATEEIIYKDYVHIGIAVDTPRGLVVPVLRDADRKSLPQIAAELRQIGENARNVKFGVADLRGATFTITNYGAVGGVFGTPMVNFPESGILGLGRARLQPVVFEGQIVPRLILPLSLSFDHRIVDGADAARFTTEVIQSLENPLRLISL